MVFPQFLIDDLLQLSIKIATGKVQKPPLQSIMPSAILSTFIVIVFVDFISLQLQKRVHYKRFQYRMIVTQS